MLNNIEITNPIFIPYDDADVQTGANEKAMTDDVSAWGNKGKSEWAHEGRSEDSDDRSSEWGSEDALEWNHGDRSALGSKGTTAAREVSVRKAEAAFYQQSLSSAREYGDALGDWVQSHGEVVRRLSADGKVNLNSEKLLALREDLAGAELSDQVDLPSAEAAQEKIANLSQNLGRQARAADSNPDPVVGAGGGTLGEIWQELSSYIGIAEKGDLADYSAALDKYTYLYQQLANLLGKLGDWVKEGKENELEINFKAIAAELDALIAKYEPKYGDVSQDQVIAGASKGGFKTKAEADAICETLGLDPAMCSHRNSDGTYCVIPDISQLKLMRDNVEKYKNDEKKIMPISTYNAWKTGFDSQMSRIEDSLQTRGQKYSNCYSRFENFHKTISSMIQSMADMLKGFLHF